MLDSPVIHDGEEVSVQTREDKLELFQSSGR